MMFKEIEHITISRTDEVDYGVTVHNLSLHDCTFFGRWCRYKKFHFDRLDVLKNVYDYIERHGPYPYPWIGA